MDFQRKVLILRNTFVNFLKKLSFRCRHSKILLLEAQNSTPLSRIRNGVAVLSREFEGQIADPRQGSLISCGHSSILRKSCDFAAYIQKLCFWGIKNQHPYRGCVVEWPFRRENSRVRSRILDRGRRNPALVSYIHTHAPPLPVSHRDGSRHGD